MIARKDGPAEAMRMEAVPVAEDTPAARGGRLERWLVRPALWHAAFWAFHLLNELLISVVERRPLAPQLGLLAGVYAALAVPAYVNLGVLVPRLWRRGHHAANLVALVAVAALSAALYRVVRFGWAWDGAALRSELRWTFTGLMYAASIAALDVAARHVRDARRRAREEREHAERRLDQLRAQVNPHFLFNTLNSLYALAVAGAPELPERILQHAGLLRYALDQTRLPRVPLAGEVDFMEAYVSLERLRLEDEARVRLEIHGVLNGQQVAPMIFAPLVENCFKHLGAPPGEAPFVDARLEVSVGSVRLRLRNSCDPHAAPPAREGIGLRNTRERLELLYPGRHRLSTRREGGAFHLDLALEL